MEVLNEYNHSNLLDTANEIPKNRLKNKCRIFICGDTHGTLDVDKLDRLKLTWQLNYNDYLIICGDSGIVWSSDTLQKHIKYFESLQCYVLYVDGNHENYDMLNKYPVEVWHGGKIQKISEHIYHLLRGQVFNICNKTFLTIGGADSSDKEYREEHISWWSDETITYDDINEAKQNLEKIDYKVDYVITHTPSSKTLNDFANILTQCGESIPSYLQSKIITTPSTDMLNFVNKNVKYKQWFCGHLHIDEIVEKTQILYCKVVEIM